MLLHILFIFFLQCNYETDQEYFICIKFDKQISLLFQACPTHGVTWVALTAGKRLWTTNQVS